MRGPCLCGADDCPRCYPGSRHAPDEDAVRELAEGRARDLIADASELYELVQGQELDIWVPLAAALAALDRVSANDTPSVEALNRLSVIHSMVFDAAVRQQMDAARDELRERNRRGKTRYCEEDE